MHDVAGQAVSREWVISTYSNGHGCVEVKFGRAAVFIRDTKYRRDADHDPSAQPMITVPIFLWKAFLDNAGGRSAGIPSASFWIDRTPLGGAILRSVNGTVLNFTPFEWTSFLQGVHAGEFAGTR